MISYPFYVSHYFRVVFFHYYFLARGYEGNCKEVDETGTILKRENALPYPQGLKKLELLSEEEC